jgi:chromosome segregation ATPase
MPFSEEVEAWHQEQREQWATNNTLLEAIRDAQGGFVSQLDDLMAAVAADQAATDSAVALLNSLQDQVTALQASVADLQAQIDANQPVDLTGITAQVQGLADALTAAEAPN